MSAVDDAVIMLQEFIHAAAMAGWIAESQAHGLYRVRDEDDHVRVQGTYENCFAWLRGYVFGRDLHGGRP